MMTLAISGSVLLVFAVIVGRWWVVLVPVVLWPLSFVGRVAGWWGSGVGDGWPAALVIGAIVGVCLTLIGIALHRALASTRRHTA